MDYTFLLDLAIILLFTKLFGLLMKKLGLPQVVGALLAGILIGPAIWSPMTGDAFVPVRGSEFLKFLAELGVIMIMFGAGLETDLKELKRSGLKATIIAFAGVIVPLVLGFCIAIPFFGLKDTENILKCVFIGVIITATSVSITVETLRELGKLKGKVGTVILSAAIIDDVIGIIVLTFVIGLQNPSEANPYMVLLKTALFFVIGIGVGIGLNYLFRWLEKRYPHNRRVPIFGLVVCFLYAYCAVKFFGIADITGAYLAGIILSNTKETGYIERKVDVSSYMIFSPIFFANIGIETSFVGFEPQILLFCLMFVLAGLLGKVIGCGLAARACGFGNRDSIKIGVGMMARGEVALIVASPVQKSTFGYGVCKRVDDTPGMVVLSSFDPIRRQVARYALERLMKDGRINPSSIEEAVAKAEREIEKEVMRAGEDAAREVGVVGIPRELLHLLGELKFRTSYGQNVLLHSVEMTHIAGMIAEEIGADKRVAKTATLLHDIGKAVTHKIEGKHAEIGAELAKKYGMSDEIVHAMAAHHDDIEPTTPEALIVKIVDSLSAARPGARNISAENFAERMRDLENIATSFPGIDKAYAISAGREIRVIVEPKQIDDLSALKLARDIANKIEATMSYPGVIKVNVIRETRAVEYAK